ncbi:MAG: hypothetical protein N2110_02195 [Flavobacteriales bacterium]|nr:hypothetical protein [Flavobacteriales bacterium]MCX7767820.1 hypothetical protein [Flavobacteriales bacterium]MDW8409779.1 hypothetical protein [Flavobacteriales bacterium]
MDRNELIIRIKNAALALVHQAERLSQPHPSRTDFEATLANVRSLYEYISVLNYLHRFGEKIAVPPGDRKSDKGSEKTEAARALPETKANLPEEKTAGFLQRSSSSESKTFVPGPPFETVLADRLRLMPVDDLRKAISLADKFLYIYELFGGENNTYHTVLDTLNNTTDRGAAESYLKELEELYGWDPESTTVKRFKELVIKRFGS